MRKMPRRPVLEKRFSLGRLIAFLYGLVAYLVFFVTFLYAIGFVIGPGGAQDHRHRHAVPLTEALIVNLLLMSVFAIQHSVMARTAIQEMVDAIRAEIGRAQHLCAVRQPRARSAVLAVASDAGGGLAGRRSANRRWRSSGLSFVGWLIVLTSTFLINHFELFGLHQVANNLAGRADARRRGSARRCSTSSCGTRSISASSSRSGRRRP